MALIDNIFSYWKLDESSGNASDSTANARTATNSNVTYAAGKINNGAVFNGTTAKFTFASTSTMPTASTGRTIAGWLYINSLDAHLGQPIICGGTNSTGNADFFRTGSIDDGGSNTCLSFEVWGSAGVNSTSGVITTGTWQHVAVTIDTSSNVKLYVNGSNVTSGTPTKSPVGWAMNVGGGMGFAFAGSTAVMFLNGKLDEVGIWSRALSGAEISELYNSGSGLSYPFTADAPKPAIFMGCNF